MNFLPSIFFIMCCNCRRWWCNSIFCFSIIFSPTRIAHDWSMHHNLTHWSNMDDGKCVGFPPPPHIFTFGVKLKLIYWLSLFGFGFYVNYFDVHDSHLSQSKILNICFDTILLEFYMTWMKVNWKIQVKIMIILQMNWVHLCLTKITIGYALMFHYVSWDHVGCLCI